LEAYFTTNEVSITEVSLIISYVTFIPAPEFDGKSPCPEYCGMCL